MKAKVLSMLGLCRRAGKLAMGNDPVLESMQKKDCHLLLAAQDLSPRTLKGIMAANQEAVPLLQLKIPMDEIGFAIGKRVGILSIQDAGFAKNLESLCTEIKES